MILNIIVPAVSLHLGYSCSFLFRANLAQAQADPQPVGAILSEEIQSPQVSLFQLRHYLLQRVAKPPAPASARQWTVESKRLREASIEGRCLSWLADDSVDAPPKFEDLGIH